MAVHRLTSSDGWFIDMHRRDPLTHGDFRFGDHVVVCSHCRSVQLAESWEFNSNQCCICGDDEQESGFERSFIDYDYTGKNAVSSFLEDPLQEDDAAGRIGNLVKMYGHKGMEAVRQIGEDIQDDLEEDFDRIGNVLDHIHAYHIGRILGIMIWTLTIFLSVIGSGLLLKSNQSMAEHFAEHRDMMIAHTEEKIEEIKIAAEDKVNTKLIPLVEKALELFDNAEDKLLTQSGKIVSKAAQKAEEISGKGKMMADTVWVLAVGINEWFWSLIDQIGALVGTAG